MKKNSQIHLYVDSNFIDYLKRQAISEGISFSELCRQKLNQDSRLARMESMLDCITKGLLEKYGDTNDKSKSFIKSRDSISIAK